MQIDEPFEGTEWPGAAGYRATAARRPFPPYRGGVQTGPRAGSPANPGAPSHRVRFPIKGLELGSAGSARRSVVRPPSGRRERADHRGLDVGLGAQLALNPAGTVGTSASRAGSVRRGRRASLDAGARAEISPRTSNPSPASWRRAVCEVKAARGTPSAASNACLTGNHSPSTSTACSRTALGFTARPVLRTCCIAGGQSVETTASLSDYRRSAWVMCGDQG